MTERRGNDVAALCVPHRATITDAMRVHAGAAERGLPAGIALVLDEAGAVLGTLTDGDVRRALLAGRALDSTVRDAMNRNPILFPERTTYREIVERLPGELQQRGRRSRRFLGKIVLVDEARRPTRVLDYHELWQQRVATHRHVVVVGMGYVGLTLGLVLSEEGFAVTGVDSDASRVKAIADGDPYVHENGLPQLLRERLERGFSVQQALPDNGDVFVLAVGTPVVCPTEGRPVPDLAALEAASQSVGEKLAAGGLVVLRSTVPLGATRGIVLPILERASGLRAGIDFHLAFAPERTAEGKALEELRSLPQVIGGLNEDSVEATVAVFRELTPTIVRVESLEAAELAKLVNNAYRDLTFAFANQVAQIGARFDMDVVEVIRAANRGYPRDQVPLPSPGVGGPCLTKDPYILATAAKTDTTHPTLFELGRRVNESMHAFVARDVLGKLREVGKDPAKCSVLVCGLAFKGHPETGDVRNSSAIEIAQALAPHLKKLYGHDVVANAQAIRAEGLDPVTLPDGFRGMDAVLFLNNHRYYAGLDIFAMVRSLAAPGVVYDAWHAFRPEDVVSAAPAVYMGLGFARSSVMAAVPGTSTC